MTPREFVNRPIVVYKCRITTNDCVAGNYYIGYKTKDNYAYFIDDNGLYAPKFLDKFFSDMTNHILWYKRSTSDTLCFVNTTTFEYFQVTNRGKCIENDKFNDGHRTEVECRSIERFINNFARQGYMLENKELDKYMQSYLFHKAKEFKTIKDLKSNKQPVQNHNLILLLHG